MSACPQRKPIPRLCKDCREARGARPLAFECFFKCSTRQALPFTKVQHAITTIDAQPSNPSAGPLLVTVTGGLLVDEERNPRMTLLSFPFISASLIKDTQLVTLIKKQRNSLKSFSSFPRVARTLCTMVCVFMVNGICKKKVILTPVTFRHLPSQLRLDILRNDT